MSSPTTPPATPPARTRKTSIRKRVGNLLRRHSSTASAGGDSPRTSSSRPQTPGHERSASLESDLTSSPGSAPASRPPSVASSPVTHSRSPSTAQVTSDSVSEKSTSGSSLKVDSNLLSASLTRNVHFVPSPIAESPAREEAAVAEEAAARMQPFRVPDDPEEAEPLGASSFIVVPSEASGSQELEPKEEASTPLAPVEENVEEQERDEGEEPVVAPVLVPAFEESPAHLERLEQMREPEPREVEAARTIQRAWRKRTLSMPAPAPPSLDQPVQLSTTPPVEVPHTPPRSTATLHITSPTRVSLPDSPPAPKTIGQDDAARVIQRVWRARVDSITSDTPTVVGPSIESAYEMVSDTPGGSFIITRDDTEPEPMSQSFIRREPSIDEREQAAATIQTAWRAQRFSADPRIARPSGPSREDTLVPLGEPFDIPMRPTVQPREAREPSPIIPPVELVPDTTTAGPPIPEHEGWRLYALPDGSTYYHHPTVNAVSDAWPLPLPAPAPEGWEAHIGRSGSTRYANHERRIVMQVVPSTINEVSTHAGMEYWEYLAAHPAHAELPPTAADEAEAILSWARADNSSSYGSYSIPFSQSEAAEQSALLRESKGAAKTHAVARVLHRFAEWKVEVTEGTPRSGRPVLPRFVIELILGTLLLSVPFAASLRMQSQRDAQVYGYYSPTPTLMIAACSYLMAAVILSLGVSFISLRGMDTVARVSALVAVLCSIASMAGSMLTLTRYKLNLNHIPTLFNVEGLLVVAKSQQASVVPLVLLGAALVAIVIVLGVHVFQSLSRAPSLVKYSIVGIAGGLAGAFVMGNVIEH